MTPGGGAALDPGFRRDDASGAFAGMTPNEALRRNPAGRRPQRDAAVSPGVCFNRSSTASVMSIVALA